MARCEIKNCPRPTLKSVQAQSRQPRFPSDSLLRIASRKAVTFCVNLKPNEFPSRSSSAWAVLYVTSAARERRLVCLNNKTKKRRKTVACPTKACAIVKGSGSLSSLEESAVPCCCFKGGGLVAELRLSLGESNAAIQSLPGTVPLSTMEAAYLSYEAPYGWISFPPETKDDSVVSRAVAVDAVLRNSPRRKSTKRSGDLR